ncbi:succinate dehydrogenase, hydrophobic membrane anchor protein [Ferrovibrio sp.]|uniref:succinate dehydrogenase, hydrophobic membrane anchor protein n=1 Tax=Ferrovibrio sp. TaxID=1917215 RepID=UPI001B65587C|nr:succinate dehydrogenase, hydrophobic membrane anchor protein [Ferrovibrio sp.]MBP7065924.1 succinate dehydrogenase, hydrophobic membrane anchor protein [Ferrovibrio sp.]
MTNNTKTMRSPLKRVRGLGSAKEGVQHWWVQRVTAVAMVPLLLILVVVMLKLGSADHAAVVAAFKHPLLALIALLAVLAMFWHLKLGLQVVVEDYIHVEGTKIVVQLVLTFAVILVGALCALSILKLFFGA